jgi:hypothetical protein
MNACLRGLRFVAAPNADVILQLSWVTTDLGYYDFAFHLSSPLYVVEDPSPIYAPFRLSFMLFCRYTLCYFSFLTLNSLLMPSIPVFIYKNKKPYLSYPEVHV